MLRRAERTNPVVLAALAVALTACVAAPADAAPLRRTERASYSQPGGAWFGGLLELYGSGIEAPTFRPPRWTRSFRVSVHDASGLPVHFSVYVNHQLDRHVGCDGAVVRVSRHTPVIVRVAPGLAVRAECLTPASVPTQGVVVVTYSSKR